MSDRRRAAAAVSVSHPGHSLHRLGGGLRVIVAPMEARASVSVGFMFGVGSRHEDDSEAGLAHFIEHMVFKGGARFPTARAISEQIERVGGSLDAATDREATVFSARVPAQSLALAVDVLADMLFAPAVDPGELSKERLVVIEELRSYVDTPQEHVNVLFDEVMWPGHPLGRDVAGREETVRSFERDDCLRHLRAHYRLDNLVVAVAGAVETEEALKLVSEALARARGGKAGGNGHLVRRAVEPAATVPSRGRGQVRLLRRRLEQANIVVGGPSCSYRAEERFASDIMSSLLGEGMSSRLFLELREERALAYDVCSSIGRLSDSGALSIYLGCDPKRAVEALRAAVGELRRLAEEGITSDELSKGREYVKGRLLLGLEGTGSRASFLGQQELLLGEILTAAEVVERLDAVDEQAVQEAAGAVLEGGLRAAVIGPFQSEERFRAALDAA